MNETLKKYHVLFIYLVLALAVRVVFWPVHNYKFINYDDPAYVTQNPHVKAGINSDSIIWAFRTSAAGNWHPLTWLSHMLDCQLFGAKAGGHHVVNLMFHLVNTLLLFSIFKRMTGAIWQSAFVAALFAMHPLNVESVAWIAERKNVLSTMFWLLTMAAYLRYVRRPGIVRYLLMIFVFALGLMAKPMLITLPFVLLLLDYWPLGRFQIGGSAKNSSQQSCKSPDNNSQWQVFYRLVFEKIPIFILSAVSSTVTFLIQSNFGVLTGSDVCPLKIRIANALVSYLMYLQKMVWPNRLAVFYPHPLDSIPLWQVAAAAVIIIAISILAVCLSRNRKYLAVGWLWYLGTLVPVIGLVQTGEQAMADRYAYVPFIGLFIIIAWGSQDLLAKWLRRKSVFGISATIVLVVLAVCTHIQLRYWRNSITLLEHSIAVTDNNYLAHYNLAHALIDDGRTNEAVAHFKEVLRIKPRHPDPTIMLAWLFATYKNSQFYNPEEAVRLAEQGCDKTNYKKPFFLDVLAAAYAATDRFPEAVSTAEKAVELAKRSEPNDMTEEIQKRLLLYKSGKPYIQPVKKSSPVD